MVTLDQAGWNRAALIVVPPPPPIAHVIELLWIDERPRMSPRAHQWRVVADDAAHLIYSRWVDRGGTERHRLHVVGARDEYTDIDCRRRVVTIGARLRAGAIPALLDVAAAELTNQSVDIVSVVRPRRLRLPVQLEGTSRDVLSGLSELIANLARRGRPLENRARWLASLTTASVNVGDIARAVGIGDRALRAWSADHLGIGVRRFLTIRRLHRALEARIARPSETWSRIAAANGFADQSHLVRDCQTLLGESPSDFLTRAD